MKVRIEIDTRTFVRFWLVVIGFALAALAIYSARTALTIIGVAFFLALALNGPVTRLARILPGKSRVGGTALAYISVILFLGVILFLVAPPIIQQTVKFAQTVPTLIDNSSEHWKGVNTLIDNNHLRGQVDNALASIKENATGWAAGIGTNVLASLGSLASIIGSALFVIVLSFLMLIEGPMWLNRLWSLYNDKQRMEDHRQLLHRMYTVVNGYVTGQLTVSAIGATTAGIVVFILSLIFREVPSNLALVTAAITFTLSLIPMFGATIAGAIITILLAFNSLTAAIIFGIFFIIYQQIENNFISPTIQSRKIELSALAVLMSVTIGLYVFGIAGGLISIPIAGCIKVLLEDYLERSRRERVDNDKPLTKLIKKLKSEETA